MEIKVEMLKLQNLNVSFYFLKKLFRSEKKLKIK